LKTVTKYDKMAQTKISPRVSDILGPEMQRMMRYADLTQMRDLWD